MRLCRQSFRHRPCRALAGDLSPSRAKERISAEWHGREDELATRRGDVEKKYLAAPADEFSQRVDWAGESVDLVNDIPSAAEIIERIVAQAAAALRQGAGLVKQ